MNPNKKDTLTSVILRHRHRRIRLNIQFDTPALRKFLVELPKKFKPDTTQPHTIEELNLRIQVFPKSQARHAWKTHEKLKNISIVSPTPVAIVEPRWWTFRRKSFYLTHWMEGKKLSDLKHLVDAPEIAQQVDRLFSLLKTHQITLGNTDAKYFISTNIGLSLLNTTKIRWHHRRRSFWQLFKKEKTAFSKNWSRPERTQNHLLLE